MDSPKAKVDQLRVSPITAELFLEGGAAFLCAVVHKHHSSDIQILTVVYFVPALSFKPLGTNPRIIQHCDHTEHLFIILILTQRTLICLQKRNIKRLRKMSC